MASDVLDELTSEEKAEIVKSVIADLEKVAKSFNIDLSNVDADKSKFALKDLMVAYAMTHGPESPTRVEDFYERPFHERMSLFSKKDY